jgi:hypothetical protein
MRRPQLLPPGSRPGIAIDRPAVAGVFAPLLPCSEIFLDVILPSCKCVLNTCSKPQAAACILSLWYETQISFDGPSRSAALPLFGACNPSRKRGIVIRNPKKFVEGWF